MQTQTSNPASAAGFSLIELMIAMTISLVVMGLAGHMIAGSFNIRGRENQRSDALADAQRALNVMSRELANSGFGLTNNGIVASDSSSTKIRFRANLNAYAGQTTSESVTDRDEDVEYSLINDGTNSYIVRLDVNTNNLTTVLANRIDSFQIHYYSSKIDYTPTTCDITPPTGVTDVADKSLAKYVVAIICVTLPERGTAGGPGYQPPSRVQLISDVMLRNSDLPQY
ncbi:MAG TPA: prepilin-type N-terminal cleavage/methylation domain-containing protein [Pyrinomonadaceae bacterium]